MNEPYMDFIEFRDLMSFLEQNVHCPYCGETRGLNLGERKEDIYFYYNVNLDDRYYNY